MWRLLYDKVTAGLLRIGLRRVQKKADQLSLEERKTFQDKGNKYWKLPFNWGTRNTVSLGRKAWRGEFMCQFSAVSTQDKEQKFLCQTNKNLCASSLQCPARIRNKVDKSCKDGYADSPSTHKGHVKWQC